MQKQHKDEKSPEKANVLNVSLFKITLVTCKQHQSEAPVSVPQRAAPQQDLLVVQRVFVTAESQRALEAIEAVVGRFTADLP